MRRFVNFDNRDDVADWLTELLDRVHELADITAEATKPRGARIMSKAALRLEAETIVTEIRTMGRAARRGLRADRTTEPPPKP